jgi:hypothetical protein
MSVNVHCRAGWWCSALIACWTTVESSAFAQDADYRGKLTIGSYHASGDSSLDVNARYFLGDWTGWVGYYTSTDGTRQGRLGIEYDWRWRRLYLVPSVQTASEGFFGGTIYAEIGKPVYLVAGASRTNLKPYVNLTFDPNESWQLGAGTHVGKADTLAIFTIWDNRLDTGQQVTHLVVRHHFVRAERLTIDVSYKSGHDNENNYVRAGATSAEYDWGRWFAKAAVDGHANFGDATMFRFGGGLRF